MAETKPATSLHTTRGNTLGSSAFAGVQAPAECKLLFRPTKTLRANNPFMGSAEDLADIYDNFFSGLTSCIDALAKKQQTVLDDRSRQIDMFLKKFEIESREKWGEKTPSYSNMEYDWHYDAIVIHHSGDSGHTNPREIEQLHMSTRSWDDVGYHFMVNPEGEYFEGRRLIYKGSHVGGANSRKIGILVMGDFHPQWWDLDDDELSERQKAATIALIHGLKNFFPGISTLGGHRDFKESECPGDRLYSQIPDIRKRTGLDPP